jgi:K+-sensing histidine kinase KdpD
VAAAPAVVPFALFAVAVGVTVARAGRGPGAVAVALAVLASDFLFLAPRRTLTLGAFTAGLLVAYAIPVAVAGRHRAVPGPAPVRA